MCTLVGTLSILSAMKLEWAVYVLPKINGVCSFLINPFFISLCDLVVPTTIQVDRSAFAIFVSEGFFVEYSQRNVYILLLRCSFIAATYAILHSHFVYRFLILFNQQFLSNYFLPYGLITAIVYCMLFWLTFGKIIDLPESEVRNYLQKSIYEEYQMDSTKINAVIAIFGEVSSYILRRSWTAILGVSAISIYSIIVIFVIAVVIVRKLNSQTLLMSNRTKKLQKQLMKALIVQSVIPVAVSFMPCAFSWYQPVFRINVGRWLLEFSTIALSAFPFLDPLALMFYVPTFRRRVKEVFGIGSKETTKSNAISLDTIAGTVQK